MLFRSNGRRAEFVTFGWKAEDVPDPQDEATFHRSQLDWDEISQPPHREMLAWYRQLIALRRRTADLSDGQLQCVVTRWDDQANWLVVHRGPITIAANLGAQQLSVDIARSSSADLRLLLASSAECRLEGNVLHVPPESVAIAGPVRYAN